MVLRRLRPHVTAALVTVLATSPLWVGSSPAAAAPVAGDTVAAATAKPPVPSDLPSDAEELADYVPANSCDPTAKPGTVALGQLLTRTYPGTSYGISRTCGVDPLPTSEHYDGRAVDWMNSVRDKEQAAQAKALISWLTATDASGTRYANARRLGVMYVIWNNRIWGAYSTERGWRPYSSCADHPEKSWDSTCHRNHVHISLSWAGAMKRTSYWTGTVAAEDYGPCRSRDLNWAPRYSGKARPTPCPRYPKVTAPQGASANYKTLVTYSGMRLTRGSTGPVVKAVQKALGVEATGSYLTQTKAAVQKFQRAHDLDDSGNMNTKTWRALLRAKAPKPA